MQTTSHNLHDCAILPVPKSFSFKSCTTGKAGGLKDYEPLKAVENQEPPKGDC